jgi:acetyltransferase-like isoleucine patch superfamily enzyme
MRPIPWPSIAAFTAMLLAVVALAVFTAWELAPRQGLAGGRGIVLCAAVFACVHAYAIAAHRLLLWLAPLRAGPVPASGPQAFRYHLYVLFYLMVFNSLIRGRIVPIPLMRLVYLALGARLGANTYSAGIIFDPTFVVIGANTLVGESALLVPHVIEGATLAHYPISIGSNVTIGAYSVIMAGVSIGDDVIVAASSVVTKGSRIPPGEMWGGTPARRIVARGRVAVSHVQPQASIEM